MGGTGVSKSQVSRLCEEIDERVKAFLDQYRRATGRDLEARRDLPVRGRPSSSEGSARRSRQ
jgi:hypothetical protein